MQRPSDPVTQFTMFWKCWLMRRGRGKPEYQPEKNLTEQRRVNQQQTQPTYCVEAGI